MPEITSQLSTALADRYRIESHLGEGGMATVYLAHDVKHDRKVALKVLRPELAAVIGAERFLQEIKVTANLQHPHILPLHDSGEADSFLYYVMPYIEGDTLRDKLDRERQLDIDEAIGITKGVAAALDYAHRQGVIHRDIKPENILLHDGQALVADFGIALAVSEASGKRLTETGLSIGTPHYMSPEQAMGDRELDARSDVYSVAAMLFEMLAGDPPYTGSSAQAIVAKVITEKAPPVTATRDTVPGHVAAAIMKALQKMPADRFKSAADFANALTNPTFTTPSAGPAAEPTSSVVRAPGVAWRRMAMPAALAVVTLLALWGWFRPQSDARSPLVARLDLDLGGITPAVGADLVISPDGTLLAITGRSAAGIRGIYLRRIGEPDFHLVPGTENGSWPSFSPDGTWLVFRDNEENAIVRVAVTGGGVLTLVDEDGIAPYDPHWGDDGTIVFLAPSGLYYTPSGGGTPVLVPTQMGYRRHPFALPDGSGILATTASGIHFVDLVADTSWELVPEGRHPTYVLPGFILYVAPSNDLFAVPFDLRSHRVTGSPIRVLDRVAAATTRRGYSVSRSGTLVHFEGVAGVQGIAENLVVIRTWEGEADTLRLPAGNRRVNRFSPDGRSIAFELTSGGGHEIHTFDLVTGATQQITFDADSDDPVWSPDGTKLLFSIQGRDSTDGEDIFVKPVDNSASETRVLGLPGNQVPLAWLGGDTVVFSTNASGNLDLLTMRLGDGSEPTAYLEAPWEEGDFALSPDGALAAVVTTETGSPEVWLREFPVPEGKWRVSFGGGSDPRWAADGRTLYYVRGSAGQDTLYAARIDRTPTPVVRSTEVVFAGEFDRWDLHPDGDRFLIVVAAPVAPIVDPDATAPRYLVVLNWFEELKERVGNQ